MSARPPPRFPTVNHRQIEAFRAVMATGTTIAAAVLLHTSQPVISKLIARLQATSGVKLFELRKSRLVPTPEAQVLLKTVERSYIGLDHISQALAELQGTHSGCIRIGSLPSFGMGFLPGIARGFMERNPGASVVIETVNSNLIKENVVTGRLDMGIVLRHIDTAGVQSVALPAINNVCVMHRSHRLADNPVVDVRDLDGEDFICPCRDSATHGVTEDFLQRHGVVPHIVAETTYAITILALARQRIGIGLVSPYLIPLLGDTDLVVRPLRQPMAVELLLITAADAPASMAAERFAGLLRQSVSEFADEYSPARPPLQQAGAAAG